MHGIEITGIQGTSLLPGEAVVKNGVETDSILGIDDHHLGAGSARDRHFQETSEMQEMRGNSHQGMNLE